jgi:hypothetical protein
MPHYCVDADPQEYGDRCVHDLTPGWCHRLPRASHQEALGWHHDIRSAMAKARMRYKAARACLYCCQERVSAAAHPKPGGVAARDRRL